MTLTSARSANLSAERAPTVTEIRDRAAWFTPGEGKNPTGRVRWNLPRGDHSTKAPEWAPSDAAFAARGMPRLWWAAARHYWSLDLSAAVRKPLWHALVEYGNGFRERQHLPLKLPRQDAAGFYCIVHRQEGCLRCAVQASYLGPLARMWLEEMETPHQFLRIDTKEPVRWRVYMQVSKYTWAKKMAPLYEAMGAQYCLWRDSAASWMAPRLRSR